MSKRQAFKHLSAQPFKTSIFWRLDLVKLLLPRPYSRKLNVEKSEKSSSLENKDTNSGAPPIVGVGALVARGMGKGERNT
jgi:hypothetical protein